MKTWFTIPFISFGIGLLFVGSLYFYAYAMPYIVSAIFGVLVVLFIIGVIYAILLKVIRKKV